MSQSDTSDATERQELAWKFTKMLYPHDTTPAVVSYKIADVLLTDRQATRRKLLEDVEGKAPKDRPQTGHMNPDGNWAFNYANNQWRSILEGEKR
jgi:hypothetical protein